MAATAQDIIVGALRAIGAYAPGDVLSAADAADALSVLNDLLDTWSTEHLTVYNNNELIYTLTPGKFSYTIGNPVAGTFQGTTSVASTTITGVTVPSGLVVGATVSAPGIPAGTTVVAIGANTVTMSVSATGAFTQQISYTAPGDFATDRPLRITNAYSRLSVGGYGGVDYPCDVVSGDMYTSIGLKGQPGPWPKVVYYNENFPLGQLLFWPVPNAAVQLHLWVDNIFSQFANLTDAINLPQGYKRALTKNLALELAPEYEKAPSPLLLQQARQSKADLKSLNANPPSTVAYDGYIAVGSKKADASWILTGGF